jgi:hypothetical protein
MLVILREVVDIWSSIDKSSSAELSEAINSMFKWYKDAAVCYAFLGDVGEESTGNTYTSVGKSRWFARGWTLQELIAPRKVGFFAANWIPIGTKQTLSEVINARTGIPVEVLSETENLWSTSIACRMSWASARQTTRVEDMAYCLLGVFGVNMPLLYGEGGKAFLRLQEEIIKMSDDQSVFAWTTGERWSAALAQWPCNFGTSQNIVSIPRNILQGPYSMTHMGLNIRLPMFATAAYIGERKIYLAVLQCQYKDDFAKQVVIYLCETGIEGVFERCPYRGAYYGHIDPARAEQVELRSIYIESPWRALYNRPAEVVCLLTGPTVYQVSVSKARGVDATWNSGTSALRLRRSALSFTHDAAAGLIFSKPSIAELPQALLIVLYFPHQSSNGTQISGIRIYRKPHGWATEEWVEKAENDLSAVHIQESIVVQETRCAASFAYGSTINDGSRRKQGIRITASLGIKMILGQQTYTLDVALKFLE